MRERNIRQHPIYTASKIGVCSATLFMERIITLGPDAMGVSTIAPIYRGYAPIWVVLLQ